MVKLTIIPKEVVLSEGCDNLPNPARKVVLDEIRQLARGTKREAEVMQWLSGWTAATEAMALVAELKVERKAEAKRNLPTQPIEVKAKVNRQSNDQMRADFDKELERAATEQARQAQLRQVYETALHHAIEEKFAWQQQQAAWERRYDPTGNWGPPNYRTGRDW